MMLKDKTKHKRGGFTLIELLVVIAIIALLSSIVLASVNAARDKASLTKFSQNLSTIPKALEVYQTGHKAYPSYENSYTPIAIFIHDNSGYYEQDTLFNSILETLKTDKSLPVDNIKTLVGNNKQYDYYRGYYTEKSSCLGYDSNLTFSDCVYGVLYGNGIGVVGGGANFPAGDLNSVTIGGKKLNQLNDYIFCIDLAKYDHTVPVVDINILGFYKFTPHNDADNGTWYCTGS